MRLGRRDHETPLRVTFRQSTGEFARSWLHEYYRQAGLGPLRRVAGPLLIALGLALRTLARGEAKVTAVGTFFFYYGIYYIARPFLLLAVTLVRRRGRVGPGGELTLELDERGLRLSDASSTSKLGWDVITAGGARSDYAWVEIRGGSRLSIPRRAFDDFAAFEAYFRDRDKWRA
ncbi:MAG TPA: hypothetical protein VFS43_29055 [Polyangiaceae bacterium]|nr:hypothetical protein [Polyangiaceae bacterium]